MDIGELLLRRGLLDKNQIEQARLAQSEGVRLDQAAVQLGFVTEDAALRALADEVGLAFVDLVDADVDLELLKDFPSRFIHRESLFPVHRNNGTLIVATSDPFNLYPLDELSVATGLTIVPVLASRDEIAKRIKTHLGVGSDTVDSLLAQSGDETFDLQEGNDAELSEAAQEPSVVRLVNEILLEAIELRASDVHIESQQSGIRVRYRIDGVLHEQPMPPEINRFQAAIISRLKIMSRLNIAERRLPQDGRIQLRTGSAFP
jgi:general secretion pathway protein E/type IV pilus assembly protein PilB